LHIHRNDAIERILGGNTLLETGKAMEVLNKEQLYGLKRLWATLKMGMHKALKGWSLQQKPFGLISAQGTRFEFLWPFIWRLP
jgi:hypothetical protein